MNKWGKRFWLDLGERVAATFLGALLTLFVGGQLADLSRDLVYTVLFVPTAVSLLKGLLANLADPESGASLIPAPAGPEVTGPGSSDPL